MRRVILYILIIIIFVYAFVYSNSMRMFGFIENSSIPFNYILYLVLFLLPLFLFIKNKIEQKQFQRYIDIENSKPIQYIESKDEIRGDYSKYISPKRRLQKAPKSIVDSKGKIVFGTFCNEFENLNLVEAYGPTRLPNWLNKYKLTIWEACEIKLKDCILLCCVSDMGSFGAQISTFYDNKTKKVYSWFTNTSAKDVNFTNNLMNGSVNEIKIKDMFLKYTNDFNNGKCEINGKQYGKYLLGQKNNWLGNYQDGSIEYSFKLERVSKPSIVSIPFPFSNNRTLYSQKDFFKIVGKIKINGQEYFTDDESTAIIDDHRGYYPRRMHYDWVTTFGKINKDGKSLYFGFNLTHNQSIDEDAYNENLIWIGEKTSLLPPVKFERSIPTDKFMDHSEWTIKDKYDMVNIKYKVYGSFPMVFHYCVVNIDYYITYGEFEGYIRDEAGEKYILDGMLGLGEDKSLLL